MSVVAVVEPGALLGRSLLEALEAESDLELRLLGNEEGDYAGLSEIRGEAVLVQAASKETLAEVDLAILCGGAARQEETLAMLSSETAALVVATDFDHPAGALRVSGVTDSLVHNQPVVVSPHPTVVLLSHLLSALSDQEPGPVSGIILLPASAHGSAGLAELLEQTRAILSFGGDPPNSVFGQQLAFNLLPISTPTELEGQVREVIGREVEITTQFCQSPVFHGISASLSIALGNTDPRGIEMSFSENPVIEWAQKPRGRAPIDVAGRDEILVAGIHDSPDSLGLWAVMDNLTRGGATNAVALVRRMLAERPTRDS